MSNDLIARLEALAGAAKSDTEQCVYRAQLACAMARLGHIKSARSEISSLRLRNGSYSPQLTAWILLAEGMTEHYESLSVAAADKFRRAYGLAIAFGDSDIRSLAAAWIAASEVLMGDYAAASVHAAEAIQYAPADGAMALARAHLVLASCLNAVGVHDALAATHYARARRFAIEARDISMQSAILYNVAAFRIGRISLEDAFGESTEKEHGIAELEVNSIANLDSGLGVESLVALVPVLRAQLLVIKKEWAAADRLYAESISGAAAQGQRRIAARYLAEQAHCHAMLGFRDSANALVASAVSQLIDRTDLDDRAACHARLSLCLTILGNTTESALHHGRAKEVRADFVAHQQAVRPKVVSMAEAG